MPLSRIIKHIRQFVGYVSYLMSIPVVITLGYAIHIQKAIIVIKDKSGLIKQFWLESGGVYGYRKIFADMMEHGESIGINRVHKLMKTQV